MILGGSCWGAFFFDVSNYFTKKETQFTHILSTKKHASLSKLHETGPRSLQSDSLSNSQLAQQLSTLIVVTLLSQLHARSSAAQVTVCDCRLQ